MQLFVGKKTPKYHFFHIYDGLDTIAINMSGHKQAEDKMRCSRMLASCRYILAAISGNSRRRNHRRSLRHHNRRGNHSRNRRPDEDLLQSRHARS